MKNKGFTLVEVMAIVIIIAAIALVSFPVLTNVMKNNEKLEEDTFKENAIKAAKTYCNLNKSYDEEGICSVDISKLIEESYLDKPTNDDVEYNNHAIQCNNNGDCEYQTTLYPIGKEIVLNNEKYNVIGEGDDYVTLLKQQPLTANEINTYGGVGTDNNHVNMHSVSDTSASYYHQAYDWGDPNHSGGMAYYSSPTCGYNGSRWINSGCTTYYNSSEVKYVVDAWAADKFTDELKIVDGYSARLAQKEELRTQFYPNCSSTASYCDPESTTPSWLYKSNYWYWTMSPYSSSSRVWNVDGKGNLYNYTVIFGNGGTVRPVINVYKSKLS